MHRRPLHGPPRRSERFSTTRRPSHDPGERGPVQACSSLLDEPPTPLLRKCCQGDEETLRRGHGLIVAPPDWSSLPRFSSPWSKKPSFPLRRTQQQDLGLRPQHITGEPPSRHRDALMRSLHAVGRSMAEGNIPGSIVSWIASGSFTARKKDGSHQPVAVGETLRRLIAKALLAAVSEDMTRYLRHDCGSEPRAAVKPPTVHAIRRWLRKHDNDGKLCLLTVDLESAFDQIDRCFFLQEIRRVAPSNTFVLFGPEHI